MPRKSTRRCLFCGTTIRADAIKCDRCKATLTGQAVNAANVSSAKRPHQKNAYQAVAGVLVARLREAHRRPSFVETLFGKKKRHDPKKILMDLVGLGSNAVPALTEALKDQDEDVRADAAAALAKIKMSPAAH